MKDLTSLISPVVDVPAATRNGNAATNGAGVDLAGFNSASVVFHSGTLTDGSLACKIQEADDAAFTVNAGDVAAADCVGGVAAQTLAATDDNTAKEIGYIGKRRYLRGVITQSGATTGGVYGSVVVRGNAVKQPAT